MRVHLTFFDLATPLVTDTRLIAIHFHRPISLLTFIFSPEYGRRLRSSTDSIAYTNGSVRTHNRFGLGGGSFAVAGPRLLNSLPTSYLPT